MRGHHARPKRQIVLDLCHVNFLDSTGLGAIVSSLKRLEGKVAVVAGATRGAGHGIAVELGAAGATVYVTGRTLREGEAPLPTADELAVADGLAVAARLEQEAAEQAERIDDEPADEARGGPDAPPGDEAWITALAVELVVQKAGNADTIRASVREVVAQYNAFLRSKGAADLLFVDLKGTTAEERLAQMGYTLVVAGDKVFVGTSSGEIYEAYLVRKQI